ncbi:MAG TPA: thiazole biosynthesis protein, partial [Desulfurococcaceae archaeon]|nr:thiazole biosynthesis protein [Desulfurococcaceae archaeon]
MQSYEVYSEGVLFRLFINEVMERLASIAKVDVIIVGAGPAGLSAAISLAEKKLHVVVFERMLGVGGGIRGGGMLLPLVLVEEGYPRQLLEECGVKLKKLGEGLYAADPTESMVKLAAKAIDNGTIIIPGITVEDLITRIDNGKLIVKGVVINWSPIVEAKWHVDPLMVESRAVVDATGHDAGIVRVLA